MNLFYYLIQRLYALQPDYINNIETDPFLCLVIFGLFVFVLNCRQVIISQSKLLDHLIHIVTTKRRFAARKKKVDFTISTKGCLGKYLIILVMLQCVR